MKKRLACVENKLDEYEKGGREDRREEGREREKEKE